MGSDLYIMDWLSMNNHTEMTEQEIIGMNTNVSAISTLVNRLVCTSMEEIQAAKHEDTNLQKLK